MVATTQVKRKLKTEKKRSTVRPRRFAYGGGIQIVPEVVDLSGTKPHKPIRTNGAKAFRLIDEINGRFAAVIGYVRAAQEGLLSEKPGALPPHPHLVAALELLQRHVSSAACEGADLLHELGDELAKRGFRP